MSENKTLRLSKVAKEMNVGLSTIIDFLNKSGLPIDSNPNTKVDDAQYALLLKEFQSEKIEKEKVQSVVSNIGLKASVTIEEKIKTTKGSKEEDFVEEILIKDSGVKKVEEVTESKKEEPVVEEEKKTTKVKKVEEPKEEIAKVKVDSPELKVLGKIDLDTKKKKTTTKEKEEKPTKKAQKEEEVVEEKPKKSKTKKVEEVVEEIKEVKEEKVEPIVEEKVEPVEEKKEEIELVRATVQKLGGPTILGKIELKEPTKSQTELYKDEIRGNKEKKKRQRISPEQSKKVDPNKFQFNKDQKPQTGGNNFKGKPNFQGGGKGKKFVKDAPKPEVSEEDIQKQIKETLARLSERTKSKSVKLRKDKRANIREKIEEQALRDEEEKSVLKVTEFVSVSEMASMMDVPATKVIGACMSLGLFVSINQRLDAETISIIAEEFGFTVNFVSAEIQEAIDDQEEDDSEEDLIPRSPVVTVMGHVDHGKTSLLDYIRKANVIAGEAGGITQHIGAYNVMLEDGRHITFIDTPGHEAFTAMRARGAQITDVAIIVVAADDSVMPQTIEAINHAKAAGVPMVFAINKIDKPGANPDKIREALAGMNILVEEWGGTFQCQEVSAKQGLNIDKLLEKVLLESEMLQLKANPKRRAIGSVIEAQLDKGKGYICTVLIQNGTLEVGDVILAGPYSGRVKAMYNEREQRITSAGPSTPVRILGLTGAPQAGDKFNSMEDEREAREIATKRLQLQREQGMRAKKHITLDEIGRRIAIGDFKQLNIIIKGDTDGSVEALSDSLLKLSTEKIQVNAIHKSVGAISESDVLLASASDAIIVGFQVRPTVNAKKLAEKEEIDIRSYSIIYQAIDEIKAAMEGMLSPEIVEKVMGNIEIREVFNITKVGQVAGCYVLDGKVSRSMKIRIIRDGIVIHTGKISALKRFKDDVKDVSHGYECGLSVEKFEKMEVGDIIEAFEEQEVKAKL